LLDPFDSLFVLLCHRYRGKMQICQLQYSKHPVLLSKWLFRPLPFCS
jgi:hypothetical protein